MAFDVFKNVNRSMFGQWMKEILERIEVKIDDLEANGGGLAVTGTPASGQVVKWNGSAAQWDSDLTTGGTGVLISGTAIVPAAGTGSNGDYFLSTATGLLWGPKAAGAWPALPFPRGNGILRSAVELPAIPFDNSSRADVTLNQALVDYGHLQLQSSVLLGSPNVQDNFPQRPYRISAPVLIQRFGSLTGTDSYLFTLGPEWLTGPFTPMIGWTSTNGGLGPAQAMRFSRLQGVSVSSQYSSGTDTSPVTNGNRIIGISSGLKTNASTGAGYPPDIYTLTHARNIIEDCAAWECYYNFLLTMDQYSIRRNLKAGSGKVGFCHYQSYNGGGMVDMPEIQNLLCWGNSNQVGHLFIFNRAVYPIHPYILRGSWSKAVGCAYAFVWNPLESPAGFGQEIVLDGGSTEFNTAGGEGLDATIAVECLGRDTANPWNTFTHNVRKVELDIDKYLRVVVRDYTFQTDGPAWAYLRGPGARVALQKDTAVPEQVRMAVRAADVAAHTLFEDCQAPTGGCWENVARWDMTLRTMLDATNSNRAAVFCGWADPELVSAAPTELALATFTNRLAPNFSASENGVTVSTVLDTGGSDPSGDTVTVLSFPSSKSAGERALTPFLGGGASAKSYASGQWRWSFVQLKNMHTQPVRVVPYMRNAGGFLRGADPSFLGGVVEAAVTLWPDQWMVVAILWCHSSDARLCIERADTTTTAFAIRATKLADVRLPLSKRAHLNRAMQRMIWR